MDFLMGTYLIKNVLFIKVNLNRRVAPINKINKIFLMIQLFNYLYNYLLHNLKKNYLRKII